MSDTRGGKKTVNELLREINDCVVEQEIRALEEAMKHPDPMEWLREQSRKAWRAVNESYQEPADREK